MKATAVVSTLQNPPWQITLPCCQPRCRQPSSATRAEPNTVKVADWALSESDDEWAWDHEAAFEDSLDDYLSDDSVASYGYEWVGGALAVAVIASFLKVLLYLAIVCWTLLATAFQYSVVAIALVAVIVFFG